MISAIISDIHGNLPALELLLKKTKFVEFHQITPIPHVGPMVVWGVWLLLFLDLAFGRVEVAHAVVTDIMARIKTSLEIRGSVFFRN